LNVTIRSLNAYSENQGILYQTEPILEGTAITKDNFFAPPLYNLKAPSGRVVVEPSALVSKTGVPAFSYYKFSISSR
jgi:hypothetical protein